jgi:hypothetical protein
LVLELLDGEESGLVPPWLLGSPPMDVVNDYDENPGRKDVTDRR